MSTTLRLGARLSTFAPSRACEDEVAVYHEALVYTLDAEHSGMWLWGSESSSVEEARQVLLDSVMMADVVAQYARPVVLSLSSGDAVGLLWAPRGMRVVDAAGVEVVAT